MPPPDEPHWQPERHRPLLRVLAQQLRINARLPAHSDASDLVHDVLLKAHKRLGQFRGTTEAELVCWLREILHKTFLDMVRRDRAQARDSDRERNLQLAHRSIDVSSVYLDNLLQASGPSPAEWLQRQEWLLRVAKAVDSLPSGQRDVIILRYFQDLPVRDIAAQLERTPRSVSGLLRRGLAALRKILPDERFP